MEFFTSTVQVEQKLLTRIFIHLSTRSPSFSKTWFNSSIPSFLPSYLLSSPAISVLGKQPNSLHIALHQATVSFFPNCLLYVVIVVGGLLTFLLI